jgi:hypothetical protein
VHAIGSKLGGRDVVADVAATGGLGEQVPDEAGQAVVRLDDVFAAVHQRREVGAVRPAADNLRVGVESGFDALAWGAGLAGDLG